jgi:hypothetical protein
VIVGHEKADWAFAALIMVMTRKLIAKILFSILLFFRIIHLKHVNIKLSLKPSGLPAKAGFVCL